MKLKWFKAICKLSNYDKQDMENILLEFCKNYNICIPSTHVDDNILEQHDIFDFGD